MSQRNEAQGDVGRLVVQGAAKEQLEQSQGSGAGSPSEAG